MENAVAHLKVIQRKSEDPSTSALSGGLDVVFNSKKIKLQFDKLGSTISAQFDWMRGDPKINESLRKPLQPLNLNPDFPIKLHMTKLLTYNESS